MFTVKIIYNKSRRQVLLPAHSVEFIPAGEVREEPPKYDAGLLINHGVEAENGCHLTFSPPGDEDWRDVFVMNANGQTVARYTL